MELALGGKYLGEIGTRQRKFLLSAHQTIVTLDRQTPEPQSAVVGQSLLHLIDEVRVMVCH